MGIEQKGNPDYKFQYNGKEKQEELGLAWSDFETRMYDAQLGRWHVVDPKANDFSWQSPYTSMDNNPINVIDPDGQSGVPIVDKESKTITVYSTFVFYGSQANNELSAAIANEIAWQYNSANGKVKVDGIEYSVKFKIHYKTVTESEAMKMADGNTNAAINFVRVEKNNIRYHRSFNEVGENSGFMNTDDNLGKSTTAPHEIGHGYGLTHVKGDQRGNGQPGIMAARGTAVDAGYTYNPKAGDTKDVYDSNVGHFVYSNTINPATRRVTQQNITTIFRGVTFDKNGRGQIGNTTNRIYDTNGYEKKKTH